MTKYLGLILIISGLSAPAYAYLDPGSLSMFLQAIVAGVVGGIFFFRKNLAVIKDKLFKNKQDAVENKAEETKE